MRQPAAFEHVDTISHNGTVIVFGEEWRPVANEPDGAGQALDGESVIRRLWYRVLDLEKTAGPDQEGAWEDATRWTRWYEVPWSAQLRPVGLGLLTVDCTADQNFATVAGRWKALTDGACIYLFRALNLRHGLNRRPGTDQRDIRVYANRYTLVRAPSPDAGTNKAAKGEDITVPQLQPVREARYRRSAMRETPAGDTDSQGTRDMGNLPFVEPTMEWSMLRPLDGAFTVTLTPSNLPGRMRWQFFCRAQRPSAGDPDTQEPALAAFSILRDQDGWADLEEKYDQLNAPDASSAGPSSGSRFSIQPDALFTLEHPGSDRPLELVGQPDALTFRLQEQGGGAEGDEERAISPQRVMLAARVAWPEPGEQPDAGADRTRLAVLDFGLRESGSIDVGWTITVPDVDFARTALWINSDADRVMLSPAEQSTAAFSVHAWVRHDAGTGTLICRGWAPGEDPIQAKKAGWAIEWRADRAQVVAVRVLLVTDDQGAETLQRFEAAASAPISFTWHHLALAQDDAGLKLYVDGELGQLDVVGPPPARTPAETPISAKAKSHVVTGPITIGGPVHAGPEASWPDLRIDQVVVWKRAMVPSLETIHVELDEQARQDPDLAGYWTFDRPAQAAPGVTDGYVNLGADLVSQTAPLFPPDRAEFEQDLGGMSTDMGLLAVPGWEIRSDPRLFLGADGLVRLYALAGEPGRRGDTIAGSLVYDTTTTRAQFTVAWTAEGARSTQEGALILQARKAGPVMNRAQVTLDPEASGDQLSLRIAHPHRDGLAETWRRLPRRLEDLIAVLNGRASIEPDSAAVLAGEVPHYAYGTDGPYPGRTNAYASALVQAMALSVPDNGAAALVEPGPATRRQLGNFTGWTRAPLMVSGRFGAADQRLVVASVDLDRSHDRLERLRVPGDFALEAWVRPEGGQGLQRIVNWLQGDKDGVSLCLENEHRLRLAGTVRQIELARAGGSDWFPDDGNSGATIKVRLQLPLGGGGGGRASVLALALQTSSALDLDATFRRIAALRSLDITRLPGDQQARAMQELAEWGSRAATFSTLAAYTHADIQVTLTLGVEGGRVVLDLTNEVEGVRLDRPAGDAKAVVWTNPYTSEQLDPDQTKSYIEQVLVPLWNDLIAGHAVTPPGATWQIAEPSRRDRTTLINMPLGRDEGDDVELTVVVAPDSQTSVLAAASPLWGNRGTISCSIDGRLASVFEAREDGLLAPAAVRGWARLVLGEFDARPPFAGIIDRVEIRRTGFGIAAAPDAPRPVSSDVAVFAIDFAAATPGGDGQFVVPTIVPENQTLEISPDAYLGAFRLKPTLGDRRYATARSFSAADWLHLALVCSDNFAVRFERDGDRAVINDSSGLNPDRAFTIDCVVVRESGDVERSVFAKAAEYGDDKIVTFRLTIDQGGRPKLKYTLEIAGERKVLEVVGPASLQIGRPYHLFAQVSFEEIFEPAQPDTSGGKPPPRWQIWCADQHVWVFDIVSGTWLGEMVPSDFPADDLRRELGPTISGRVTSAATSQHLVEKYGILRTNRDTLPFYDLRVKASAVPAAIGAATGEDAGKIPAAAMGWFRGLVGSVRMWRQRVPAAALRRLAVEPGLPSGVDQPAAWWRFDENKGLQAGDAAGGMTATLAREQMWVTSRATARLSLFVDGRPVALAPQANGAGVPYGRAARFTLGGLVDDQGRFSEGFTGRIDEARVWRDLRTNEEILDNMHVLLGGNEDDLVGWWPIGAGIGDRLKDASGGGNHAVLEVEAGLGVDEREKTVQTFWGRDAAPVSDDLPQVRHLLGGIQTSWTASGLSTAPMAAEYGDVQIGAGGQLRAVQKRALAFGLETGADIAVEQERGWATVTGFKTGDLDLVYIGQAQSNPTLIGYIEGAPPVPSENLTRAYWTSGHSYNAYSGNTAVRVEEAENTSIMFNAAYDRGFDLSVASELLFSFATEATTGTGVAIGGFADLEFEAAKIEANVGPRATFENSLGWMRSFATTIGTARSLSNTLALGGSWEGNPLNPDVGRRYLPDNVGYALVKSGVVNVYAIRLRKNGALLGLRMLPDPDIPEDFNILTFRLRATYTKQGTLDGMVGFKADPDWPTAMQTRGSYFRPREAANIEAEIEAYEAKLLASYERFDAGSFGRRDKGVHFQDNDPAADPRQVIEANVEMPYDWERSLSKRNIVNTYVWTSSGGFFAEEVRTSILRSESSGGSYSFKGLGGVKFSGLARVGAGFSWDIEALFGGHIQTTVVKTKEEGRDFGLSVTVGCDDLLERYVGHPPDQLYSGQAAPGKIQGYRFKSFYLVPDKSHFDHFWSNVVDDDWLESGDADARALRQSRGNLNHAWRVFHRVTYVNRVPPRADTPLPAPERKTRAVVHQGPNWQNIKLVIDVLRDAKTSSGASLAGIGNLYEQLAIAVDDLVRNQWQINAPWWQDVTQDPDQTHVKVLRDLRSATYEYMKAYRDTGLLAHDRRLTKPPLGLPGPARRVTDGLIALYTFTEGKGDVVKDVSGFGDHLDLKISDPAKVGWLSAGGLAVGSPVLIASPAPATKIVKACQGTNELTIEAWIKPASTNQDGPARVVTLSSDLEHRNFTLGQGLWQTQPKDRFDVRVRTSETSENGLPSTTSAPGTATTNLIHLVFTRASDGATAIFIDGAATTTQRTDRQGGAIAAGKIGGSFANWDSRCRLALANELTMDRPWRGEYRLVAIYRRALRPEEIKQNHRADPPLALAP